MVLRELNDAAISRHRCAGGVICLSMEDPNIMKTDTEFLTVSRHRLLACVFAVVLIAACATQSALAAPETKMIEVCGKWQVRVGPGAATVGKRRLRVSRAFTLDIAPSTSITVRGEKHEALPVYDAKAAPWTRGARPDKMVTYECTSAGLLDTNSFVAHSAAAGGVVYEKGKDYDIEPLWGTFGRIDTGSIPDGSTAYVDYSCGLNRIDSICVNARGEAIVVGGEPHNATPRPPLAPAGFTAIANVWVPGRLSSLTDDNIYPIVEPSYPADVKPNSAVPPAAELLPKTWKRIQAGEPLHILAWGDSVTAGGQASDPAHQYQQVFVELLKKRYPRSRPSLTTAGWGGRNTDSFLNEPPGAQYNFDHAVIEPKPDLIVMEFVNDAYMTPEVIEQKYSYLLKRFNDIGAEWVILTPHYVRPDWMGSATVRVETDPRPYVAGVRQFCKMHHVAIADASLRWGHLVKEGIPYTTLLSNSINHPDDRGHEMFARSIMELF